MNPTTGLPYPPLLIRLSEHLSRLSARRTIGWSVVLVFVLTGVDHLMDYRLGLSRFLVVPVALASWSLGRGPGLMIGAASVILWSLGETAVQGASAMSAWSAIVRAFFLFSAAAVLSALRRAVDEERRVARTDFLTGVANRRSFVEAADMEIRRARRYGRGFIVAYLDIDGFKAINDRYGHNQGDLLLRLVAQTIRRRLREVDIVARMGGDEFSILMPETDGDHAESIMSEIQARLTQAVRDHDWPVTFSIGAVTYKTPPASVDEMIKTADRLMYSVKYGGKNRMRFATAAPAAAPSGSQPRR